MTDNWSLKGKKIILIYAMEKQTGDKGHFGEKDFDNKRFMPILVSYGIKNIETLHQKLIEDIIKIIESNEGIKQAIHEGKKKYFVDLEKNIIKTINKRFGVDEK